ncbi:phosphorylase family protein [Oenococcus sicerae]|uniref:phosphorylase family protein n=1 Tax=Oenococcus sicerae TaxID=2203724 RepID=UPI001FAD6E12|nr:hypothetical protein [Oenococcus sicerae]
MNQYSDDGYEVVEMESAALASVAHFRGVKFGQILFTADSLANPKKWDARNRGRDAHTWVLGLGINCLVNLA